jgi:hypothetical protein
VTIEEAVDVLEGYAARGVFRGLSYARSGTGRVAFKMVWHRNRSFELKVDLRAGTLRMPVVLPEVPAKSDMYRALREFVRERQAEGRPEHRRIDPSKAAVRCSNRGGNAGVVVAALDGDLEYGLRKMIALVQEIYLGFLYDGRYYDYMIRVFDLDPDQMA